MGAPQWNLKSIRNLIAMTLQTIFVVEKVNGKRQLKGIYQITSVEENGVLLQQMDETF
jgi:homoserine trans-succinylase